MFDRIFCILIILLPYIYILGVKILGFSFNDSNIKTLDIFATILYIFSVNKVVDIYLYSNKEIFLITSLLGAVNFLILAGLKFVMLIKNRR